jgi:hypothetical protein
VYPVVAVTPYTTLYTPVVTVTPYTTLCTRHAIESSIFACALVQIMISQILVRKNRPIMLRRMGFNGVAKTLHTM